MQAAGPTAIPKSLSIEQAINIARSFTGTEEEASQLSRDLLNAIPSALEGSRDEDGRAIAKLYQALREVGGLRAFGSIPVVIRDTSVSLDQLVAEIGFPVSALAPKQSTVFGWQIAGVTAVLFVVSVTRFFHVERLAQPLLASIGAAILVDQTALRGSLFESVYRILIPQYADKVLYHECGHALVAYLLGLPLRGFALSAREALLAGIPGQGGTIFFNENLANELGAQRLSKSTIDAHSQVLMAGIAAEAIRYGEAEGGESDVSALLQLLTSLQPAWTPDQVRKQARWSVIQSVKLLRQHKAAFEELAKAMKKGEGLGNCVDIIERNV